MVEARETSAKLSKKASKWDAGWPEAREQNREVSCHSSARFVEPARISVSGIDARSPCNSRNAASVCRRTARGEKKNRFEVSTRYFRYVKRTVHVCSSLLIPFTHGLSKPAGLIRRDRWTSENELISRAGSRLRRVSR